jgi:DNA-binding winged helix-turn-helix (wHTH) protein/formylglycine-generating enzyme required for sulfatase activity
MAKPDKQLFEFGPFLLDPAERRLLRDGKPVPLTPKGFDLLLALVRHGGQLLEKDELMKQLWPDSFVEEGNLTFNISTVRKTLGDERNGQRYIETVPKRGYRFVAPVRELTDVAAARMEESLLRAQTLAQEKEEKEKANGRVEPISAAQVLAEKLRERPGWVPWAAAVTLVLVVVGTLLFRHHANLKWARESTARVEALAQAHRFFQAYDLAMGVRKYLPNDPTVARLAPEISDELSVLTEPPGARVYLTRFSPDASGKFPPRQFAGTTPINNLPIARGSYLMDIEKNGYALVRRTISSELNRAVNPIGQRSLIAVKQKLVEASRIPDRMVFVPGGMYKLVSYGRLTEAEEQLGDFFIDKFEVTNREYKEFINAGGYLKKEYWRYPFIKDGKRLTWEEAMREFIDRTGLPGARGWVGQDYPEGKGEYPVTDVSWYEAAAYAAFRGKQLPTVFQWEGASRIGMPSKIGWVLPWGLEGEGGIELRANFVSSGTAPVDQFDFGASPYGAYNMAGNVAEWCLNEKAGGFVTAGGSWADPPYMFGEYGAFPGFYSSNRLGFRCVLNSPHATGDQGAMRFPAEEVPTYATSSEANFQAWVRHYRYDKVLLDAKIVEVVETDEWRREKITYAGAKDQRAIAYLYLPKNFKPPFQLIYFIPGASAFRSLTVPQYVELLLSPHVKAGRAVFAVVLEGYVERKWPSPIPFDYSSVRYRDQVVSWVTDIRRGLDYLETRDDVEARKIAFYDISTESLALVPAIEPRYRSVVFVGIGLPKHWVNAIPEADPINFAPHIHAPKLMLHGRYDEANPLKSDAEPLYKLLREPKRLEVFNGGHVPPLEVSVPIVNAWLDRTLGPVRHD